MEQNPVWASSLGDRRWNDKWSDESLSAIHARFEHSRQVLKELQAIDAKSRQEFNAADLQKYTIVEKGTPLKKVLAELEQIQRDSKPKTA